MGCFFLPLIFASKRIKFVPSGKNIIRLLMKECKTVTTSQAECRSDVKAASVLTLNYTTGSGSHKLSFNPADSDQRNTWKLGLWGSPFHLTGRLLCVIFSAHTSPCLDKEKWYYIWKVSRESEFFSQGTKLMLPNLSYSLFCTFISAVPQHCRISLPITLEPKDWPSVFCFLTTHPSQLGQQERRFLDILISTCIIYTKDVFIMGSVQSTQKVLIHSWQTVTVNLECDKDCRHWG